MTCTLRGRPPAEIQQAGRTKPTGRTNCCWVQLDRLKRQLDLHRCRAIAGELKGLEGLLERAGIELDAALAADAGKLREVVPDVQRAVTSMLDEVKAGRLGAAPADDDVTSARLSWL